MPQSESTNLDRSPQPRFTLWDAICVAVAVLALVLLVPLFMEEEPSQLLAIGLVLVWMCCWGSFLVRGIFTNDRELMVIGAGLMSLMTCVCLILPAISVAGPAARRVQCTNNLKTIALALRDYHDAYRRYPPAYIADENGRPMHSWRVLILPFLGEKSLYERYDFSEPWDGPQNSQLLDSMPECYRCPEPPAADRRTLTSYVAVVGQETAWPGAKRTREGDFADGLSDTLLVVESSDTAIPWLKPEDLEFSSLVLQINPRSGPGISSAHRGVVPAAFADGSVRFLPEDLPAEQVRALLTIAGGETIQFPWKE